MIDDAWALVKTVLGKGGRLQILVDRGAAERDCSGCRRRRSGSIERLMRNFPPEAELLQRRPRIWACACSACGASALMKFTACQLSEIEGGN
jgi:hypothetical protein